MKQSAAQLSTHIFRRLVKSKWTRIDRIQVASGVSARGQFIA
jgi:hypothetical protein